jgi:hypothetical protein
MPSVQLQQFQQQHQQHQTSPLQTPVIITSSTNGQKFARDSIIHKNDVFQFDDVDSVHTHDSLFVPHSSLESNDFDENSSAAEENLPLDQNNNTHHGNTKKKSSSKKSKAEQSKKDKYSGSRKSKLLANLISPLIRSNSSRIITQKPSESEILNGNGRPIEAALDDLNLSETTSLEKTSSFSRHLSSLKRLIVSKNGDGRSASNLNVALDRPSVNLALDEELLAADINVNCSKMNTISRNIDQDSPKNGDDKKTNGRRKKFLNLKLTNGKSKEVKVESKNLFFLQK